MLRIGSHVSPRARSLYASRSTVAATGARGPHAPRRFLQRSPSVLLALLALNAVPWARAAGRAPAPIAPSGIRITPMAAAGAAFSHLNPHLRDFPRHDAGQAVTTVTSPDGNTLLILTSGYNRLYGRTGRMIPADSEEYVFVYDIRRGRPRQRLRRCREPRGRIAGAGGSNAGPAARCALRERRRSSSRPPSPCPSPRSI